MSSTWMTYSLKTIIVAYGKFSLLCTMDGKFTISFEKFLHVNARGGGEGGGEVPAGIQCTMQCRFKNLQRGRCYVHTVNKTLSVDCDISLKLRAINFKLSQVKLIASVVYAPWDLKLGLFYGQCWVLWQHDVMWAGSRAVWSSLIPWVCTVWNMSSCLQWVLSRKLRTSSICTGNCLFRTTYLSLNIGKVKMKESRKQMMCVSGIFYVKLISYLGITVSILDRHQGHCMAL